MNVVETQLRAFLAEHPRMPSPVIIEWIGWTRSLAILKVGCVSAVCGPKWEDGEVDVLEFVGQAVVSDEHR